MTTGPLIRLVGVNVGRPAPIGEIEGETVVSGIAKRPVDPATTPTLHLGRLNLEGDGQADLDAHGGPDKAVYAYPSEHYAAWEDELGEAPLPPAAFGENLATAGVTEADVRIGDRWAWGDAVLEVAQPRWPCFKLTLHRGRGDINARLRRSGRTGWYLRVIRPGTVPVAGPIEVIERDPGGFTVLDAHEAASPGRDTEEERILDLIVHERLAESWKHHLMDRLRHLATESR